MKKIKSTINATDKFLLEEDISVHIFSVSAAMSGVCLTVIGIIRAFINTNRSQTIADDLLLVANIMFLAACFTAYFALRTRKRKRFYALEKCADALFLSGLVVTACASMIITYALI